MSTVRRRPLHEGGVDGEEKDPLVADDNGDQWDLDDEGWGEESGEKVQTRDEDGELTRRRKILRRSTREVSTAFVCHLVLMCLYVYIHVHDATIFKRNKGKGFVGAFTYGGRWKFLTYINMWVQFLYFFLCFFTDIMPWSSAKLWFNKCCDFVFTTLALPMSAVVTILFWGIYIIDRELIFPKELDEFIPAALVHYAHTAVLITALIELVLVFHRFPSNMVGIGMMFAYSTAYIIWIVWNFTVTKTWVYPFIDKMPLPVITVFFAGCFFFNVAVYFGGKVLCYLTWRERHKLMDELEL